ncbi:MAG: DUF1788 domain-containing protein [Clostridiales bacterium]|nr:DUF1788 domain-containing protein [Clostridiales bacterium]
MKHIYERLEKLLNRIRDKSFRENKGLGNEVGFHIFDYDPEDELIVRDRIKYIKNQIKHEEFEIQEFDLHKVMLEILDEKGFLPKILKTEEKKGSEKIIPPIRRTLRFNQKDDKIVAHIRSRINQNAVVFLTGIGRSWPIIRSHSILNSLHVAVEKVPVIMFFPGTYDGQTLVLFNEFKDDNYYRAFKIIGR